MDDPVVFLQVSLQWNCQVVFLGMLTEFPKAGKQKDFKQTMQLDCLDFFQCTISKPTMWKQLGSKAGKSAAG